MTLRQIVLGSVTALIVLGAGSLTVVYYRLHTPGHLTKQAALALEQGDTEKAASYLQEALAGKPDSAVEHAARLLLARTYLRVGREEDARTYIEASLAAKKDDDEALGLLMDSYVFAALRKQRMALQPLTPDAALDVVKSIDAGTAAIAKLEPQYPKSPRLPIARAELAHLRYQIQSDQLRQAKVILDNPQDTIAAERARRQRETFGSPPPEQARDAAVADLAAARKKDPASDRPIHLMCQYYLEDKQYDKVMAIFREMLGAGPLSQYVAIDGANALLQDAKSRPKTADRFNAAKGLLEEYLTKEPNAPRIMVALGQVVLELNDVARAQDLAARTLQQVPYDLDAQILQINCKLREHKTAEALSLANALLAANGNVAQVWYLLGQANSDAGNYQAAEDAYRKALSLQNVFVSARRGLLLNYLRAGNTDQAVRLAPQLLADDPYYMPAWNVYVDSLRASGRQDEAAAKLRQLAADPAFPIESRPELVRALTSAGMYPEAQAMLASVEKDGTPADIVLRLRANLAAAQGQSAAARQFMADAVAKDPGNVEARLEYAEVLLRARLLPDARGQLEQVSKAAQDPDQLLRIAAAYLSLRMPEQADAAARRALAIQPRNLKAMAYAEQARAMAASRQPGDLATQLSSDAALTVADLGRLANLSLEQKNFDRALQLARAGLLKDPANLGLRLIAARALHGKGQTDQAFNELALAAKQQPQELSVYQTLLAIYEDKANAAPGIEHADTLAQYNAVYAAWAKGRFALAAGKPDAAIGYFNEGMANQARAANPLQAREILYNGLLSAHLAKNDDAGYQALIARIAADKPFGAMARLAAADRYLALNQREAAKQQLMALEKESLLDGQTPRVVVAVAQRWVSCGEPAKGIALAEGLPAGQRDEPQVLNFLVEAYQQAGQVEKALGPSEALIKADPLNPSYRQKLAQLQANLGQFAQSLATLKECEKLGQTGAALASASRIRLYVSLGLLQAAADEVAASAKSAQPGDYRTILALGDSWAQLKKPAEARKQLAAIPPYAEEYGAARVLLARLDEEDGKLEDAIAALKPLRERFPDAANGPLYQILMRANRPTEALDLAAQARAAVPAGTTPWNNWTILAATAARDAGQLDKALGLLAELRAKGNMEAQVDIAMIHLLQKQVSEADVAGLPDAAPAFLQTTLRLLAKPDPAAAGRALKEHEAQLGEANTSFVLAILASTDPAAWPALAAGPMKSTQMYRGDLDPLLSQLARHPQARQEMAQMALAQRLIESGWALPALGVLDQLQKDAPDLGFPLVQRHQALRDLRRTEARAAVAAELAKRFPTMASSRVIATQALLDQRKYAEAIKTLQPLADAEPRADLLASLSQIHEKLGHFEEAIAITRKVRAAFPEDISAANNLAYLLAQAHPDDPAAIKEARGLIDWAIDKAPRNPALADTRGWLLVLQDQPQEGLKDLARVIVPLRLQPAVHYHLGMAYLKAGQAALARLHLANVEQLADPREQVPEVPLAREALKRLPDEPRELVGPEARQ